jgi:hypothetical protein
MQPASPLVASSRFAATMLGNYLLLGLVPPVGIVGLHYCFSASQASADGDVRLAEQQFDIASRLTRITLCIAICCCTVATTLLWSRLLR